MSPITPARETAKANPPRTAIRTVKTAARTAVRTAAKTARKKVQPAKTQPPNLIPSLRLPQHPPVLIKRCSVFLQPVCPRRARGTSTVFRYLLFLRRKHNRRRPFATGRDHPRPLGRPAHLRAEHARPLFRPGLYHREGPAVADRSLAAHWNRQTGGGRGPFGNRS